jgi:ribosomal protein L7/L12
MDEIELNKLRERVFQLQDRVASLERQITFLMGQSHVPYVDTPPALPYPDVADLKRRGKLIDAIKLYRSYTGASLEAAKNYVENLVS